MLRNGHGNTHPRETKATQKCTVDFTARTGRCLFSVAHPLSFRCGLRGTTLVRRDDPGGKSAGQQKWKEHHIPGQRDGITAAKNGWDSAIEAIRVVPLEALWTDILALSEEPHQSVANSPSLQMHQRQAGVLSFSGKPRAERVVVRERTTGLVDAR
jgi:hypothetical protein